MSDASAEEAAGCLGGIGLIALAIGVGCIAGAGWGFLVFGIICLVLWSFT